MRKKQTFIRCVPAGGALLLTVELTRLQEEHRSELREQFEAVMDELLPARVVVDLRRIEDPSNIFVHGLILILKELRRREGRLTVCCSALTLEYLEMNRLADVFGATADLADAIARANAP